MVSSVKSLTHKAAAAPVLSSRKHILSEELIKVPSVLVSSKGHFPASQPCCIRQYSNPDW